MQANTWSRSTESEYRHESIPLSISTSVFDHLTQVFSRHYKNEVTCSPEYIQMEKYLTWHHRNASEPMSSWLTMTQTFPCTPLYKSAHSLLYAWDGEMRNFLINEFMRHMSQSPLFREVHQILVHHRIAKSNIEEFVEVFRKTWFGTGWNDYTGCAFEHVFIGQFVDTMIKGYHCWRKYYLDDVDNRLCFLWTYEKHPSWPLRTISFTVDKLYRKPFGSIFFGIPIDFEMILFFFAFLSKSILHRYFFNGQSLHVKTFARVGYPNVMATAYFLCPKRVG